MICYNRVSYATSQKLHLNKQGLLEIICRKSDTGYGCNAIFTTFSKSGSRNFRMHEQPV